MKNSFSRPKIEERAELKGKIRDLIEILRVKKSNRSVLMADFMLNRLEFGLKIVI